MFALFNSLLNCLNIGIMLVDKEYRVVICNKWMEQVSGLTKTEIVGEKVSMVCPCFAELKFRRILMDVIVNGQNRFCAGILHHAFVFSRTGEKAQNARHQNMQIEQIFYEGEVFALIQISDVTEHYRRIRCLQNVIKEMEIDFQVIKEAEELAKHSALHDPLTGLGNRNSLCKHLEDAMAEANRNGLQFAVLFIDLDGFKTINDTYGHLTGDIILKEVAYRLRRTIRQTDTVSRYGGDEFVVTLPNIGTSGEAVLVAGKIRQALDEIFKVPNAKVKITASIGISLYPSDDKNVQELLRKADSAMYAVKAFGKNDYRLYETSTLPPAIKRISRWKE